MEEEMVSRTEDKENKKNYASGHITFEVLCQQIKDNNCWQSLPELEETSKISLWMKWKSRSNNAGVSVGLLRARYVTQ